MLTGILLQLTDTHAFIVIQCTTSAQDMKFGTLGSTEDEIYRHKTILNVSKYKAAKIL